MVKEYGLVDSLQGPRSGQPPHNKQIAKRARGASPAIDTGLSRLGDSIDRRDPGNTAFLADGHEGGAERQ